MDDGKLSNFFFVEYFKFLFIWLCIVYICFIFMFLGFVIVRIILFDENDNFFYFILVDLIGYIKENMLVGIRVMDLVINIVD